MRDTDNAEVFLNDLARFEKDGAVPRLMIMSLGEDHTTGTRPGTFTPRACVASNDLALGRIVEGITRSKFWPETAIFVIEDDAQNGPDHVDAHRTVGLVISPYTKRNALVSAQFSTVGMIRTMELILGLPPLSQYDAAARPLFDCFTDRADLATFTHDPPRIDINELNSPTAYGATGRPAMDFDEYDRIDDFELNEILWRAIKGQDAPLPPAVRRAIAYRMGGPPAGRTLKPPGECLRRRLRGRPDREADRPPPIPFSTDAVAPAHGVQAWCPRDSGTRSPADSSRYSGPSRNLE